MIFSNISQKGNTLLLDFYSEPLRVPVLCRQIWENYGVSQRKTAKGLEDFVGESIELSRQARILTGSYHIRIRLSRPV